MTQQLTGGSFDIALSVGINDPIHAIDKGASAAIVRIVGNAAPYALIGKKRLKTIPTERKIVCIGSSADITTIYFKRMAAAGGLKDGDYAVLSAALARRAMRRSRPASPMRPWCCLRSTFRPRKRASLLSRSRRTT